VTVLLDANVLIALVDPDHVHHEWAADWFSRYDDSFATSPMTHGSLIRHLLRAGHAAGDIAVAVDRIRGLTRHEFWSDDLPFTNDAIAAVVGHRQVTDAYLCHLARDRNGHVASFDRGLTAIHPDVAILVPSNKNTG
jgi:toxin-antitoxin system PIN domain toxin